MSSFEALSVSNIIMISVAAALFVVLIVSLIICCILRKRAPVRGSSESPRREEAARGTGANDGDKDGTDYYKDLLDQSGQVHSISQYRKKKKIKQAELSKTRHVAVSSDD